MNLYQPKLADALIVLAASFILVMFRLHAFELPLETDEANYAYIGARLLDGKRLYVDLWDHQPPGVFMLFAGAIALFGDSPAVFRWMATAFSLGSLLLIFAILRRISGRPAAVLGALLFCVASSDPGTGGEGVNREIYMNTLVLAAWWLGLRGWANVCTIAPLWARDGSLPHFFSGPCSPGQRFLFTFCAGLALGVASLFKTNIAIYWLLLAVWIGIQSWKFDPLRRPGVSLVALIGFSLGPVLVWAATAGYFAATGRLSEFVEAVFLVNLDYARVGESVWGRFWTFFDPPRHEHVFHSAFPLWIAAAAALAWMLTTAIIRPNPEIFLALALLLGGFMAVCLPGHFWPHYYYLMLPAMVVVVALFIVSLLHASAELLIRRKRTSFVAILSSGLIVAVLLASEYHHYLAQSGIDITIERYNTRDFWGKAQGQNIARVTEPGDFVFVFGNDAAVYYYSGRKCASRFTMVTGLDPAMRGAQRRRELLISDLRATRPRLILVLFDPEPFPEWIDFLHEEYGEPVGWDYHDLSGDAIMAVLARKQAPIEAIDWNWDRGQARSRTE